MIVIKLTNMIRLKAMDYVISTVMICNKRLCTALPLAYSRLKC